MTPEQDKALHDIDAASAVLRASLTPPPPPPPPTYSLTASPSVVNEGSSVTFWLATTNVPAGTQFGYKLSGISPEDLSVPMEGTLTVGQDGLASLVVPVVADNMTEGQESFSCTIEGGLAAASVTVADTSTTPLPPPVDLPQSFQRPLNPSRILMLTEWLEGGGGYDREDKLIIWRLKDGPTVKVQFRAWSANAGDIPLQANAYRLIIDGVVRATLTGIPQGTKVAEFTLDLTPLPEGNCLIEVEPLTPTGETCVPDTAYMQRGAAPVPQPWMWVIQDTHTARGYSKIHWAKVPAVDAPVTVPYVPTKRSDFSALLSRSQLVETDIVPYRHTSFRTRDTDGVLTPEQMQGYYFTTLTSNEFPAGIAVLDGPRGIGSVTMPTHLQVGRNGGIYFCDPWRVGHIDPDGTVKTLAGWRHRRPAPRPLSDSPASLRAAAQLVGDWSSIPPERHGFHEAWGLAWDLRTTQQGSGPPVPNPPNPDEPQHDTNPVAFVADSQRNRVVRLEFDGKSHATPVKVTEFITGLKDPWDVVCVDGVLYVSERLSHRIAAYDATTGSFIRVVVSGPALATLTPQGRMIQRLATEAVIKAAQCVAPEGLYHLDGWLYFGSYAMAQIRRINLATGQMQVCVDVPFASVGISGGNFFKLAVSDGTVFPRHSVGFVTWAIANGGRPYLYVPNADFTAWTPWNYMVILGSEGPGRVWDTLGYGSALAFGQGRLICGTSTEGLQDIRRSAGEPIIRWADQERQKAAYEAQGLHITHGPAGWGYYGLSLPWGRSADIDAHLVWGGHTRPAA